MDREKALRIFTKAIEAGHDASLHASYSREEPVTQTPTGSAPTAIPSPGKKTSKTPDFSVRVSNREGSLGADFLKVLADEGAALGSSDALLQ